MQLSKNLTVAEFTYSATASRLGLDNSMTADHLVRAEGIAKHIFQPIREHFGVPIYLSSGYRSDDLNTAIGGSKTSQHSKAEALDLDQDYRNTGVCNSDVFKFIKDNLEFDQLIWEFGDDDNPGWVHVSYTLTGTNRNQILIAYKNEANQTKYKYYEVN